MKKRAGHNSENGTFEKRVMTGVRKNDLINAVRIVLKDAEDLYLVGGSLRDFAFGLPPGDFDFVSRRPFLAAKTAAKYLGGRSFKLGKGAALIYRIPFKHGSIDFSPLTESTIEKNLRKRDFTINSLAVHLKSFALIDSNSGLADIRDSVLRRGYPDSFADDPLRIVKAYRMRAAFPGLRWDDETRASCRRHAAETDSVPPERVQLEMIKILSGRTAAQALREMAEDNVLFTVFPGLEELKGLEQSAPHRADVFSHTLEMLELLDENLLPFSGSSIFHHSADDLLKLRLAVLFHDSGKAVCFSREGNKIRFLGHEKESAAKARACLSSLRFSNAVINEVSALCGLHMRPLLLHQEGSPSVSARRRLIRDAGENIHLLMMLSILDFSSMERSPEEIESYWNFCQGIFDLVEKEGRNIIDPPKLIGGLEALAVLGLEKPGPELGRALIALYDAQTDGDIRSEKEAIRFLKDYKRKFLTS